MVKGFAYCIPTVLIFLFILFPTSFQARHINGKPHSRHGHHHTPLSSRSKEDTNVMKSNEQNYLDKRQMMMKMMMHHSHRRADTLEIAGSSLPDCSHACGSCTPCRLVMVSFVCSSLEEAETCPMAYKCMCHNKSYPVP